VCVCIYILTVVILESLYSGHDRLQGGCAEGV